MNPKACINLVRIIIAMNSIKSLVSRDTLPYTLSALAPIYDLSPRNNFSETSLLLYRFIASSAVISSDVIRTKHPHSAISLSMTSVRSRHASRCSSSWPLLYISRLKYFSMFGLASWGLTPMCPIILPLIIPYFPLCSEP